MSVEILELGHSIRMLIAKAILLGFVDLHRLGDILESQGIFFIHHFTNS